ncbi:hypothetical protein GV51_0799 [Gardnerella vaginalis 5-1]|nr:hypothetical protein GV51_0799 [Gardnerella vaginalis 5-1]
MTLPITKNWKIKNIAFTTGVIATSENKQILLQKILTNSLFVTVILTRLLLKK